MQKVIVFSFLVFVVPGAIYWAAHDFEPPGDGLSRFVAEASALRGTPAAPETPAPPPEEKPEEKPDEAPDAGKPKPDQATTPEKPKPKPDGTPPPVTPVEAAQALYDAGRFQEAAAAFAGLDDHMHALALLGAAFARAFPINLPDAPYLLVNDGELEGFATEAEGLLNLRTPGGRSLSLPKDAIRNRTKLERPKAIERLARRITAEGNSPAVTGTRLFALLHETFAMGRPDVAAPLLARALELDESKPFFLSSIRQRVDLEFQDDFYRAFGRCQVLPEEHVEIETVVGGAPKKLGDGTLSSPRKRRSSIKNEKALALVRKALPHRELGKKLHRKVFLAGREDAKAEDIDTAVRELEAAMACYDDALKLEDSGEIHALNRYCSKLAFQLRFWREQIGR